MEIPNFSSEEQEEIINTFLSNLVGCKKVKKIKKIKNAEVGNHNLIFLGPEGSCSPCC